MVRDSDIRDGDSGTASYLIDVPDGGNVVIEGNTLRKGPNSDNPAVAISLGEESARNQTLSVVVRNNLFTSDLHERTAFVRNSGMKPALLVGNRLFGRVTPLIGSGRVE